MLPILILLLVLLPEKNKAAGIGKASKCSHKICGTCGGVKRKTKIGTALSEVCSSKCLMATKDACECKCGGEFHAGRNHKILQKILNPQLATEAKNKAADKKQTGKALVNSFDPQTIKDYLALFLYGARISTASFDRFADPNLRENKTIALNWLAKNGTAVDTLAHSFVNQYSFGMDEQETTQAIVDFIAENPDGVAKYIQRTNAARDIYEQMEAPRNYYLKQPTYSAEELGPFADMPSQAMWGTKINKRK